MKIVIAGDLFPVPSNFDRFSERDVKYLFGDKIRSLFEEADLRVCNLEGALTDRPQKGVKTGPVVFAPTSVINGIKRLGIDCCALANNHITDAGPVGVTDTIQTLEEAGIQHLGAGENEKSINHSLSFDVDGKKICLYNVAETMYNAPGENRPGAWLYDELIVCRELESLKNQCDLLIVIYHGGSEKYRYPSPQTRRRFHRMADAGADVILSQHTHCVGSEEYYNGSYLLYGQGNFLFRSFNNEFTDTGLIVELVLGDDGYEVRKQLVDAVGDTVRYDERQDFTAFNERSSKIADEDFLAQKFDEYCLGELPVYLKAYKGKILGLKVIRRFFPKWYKRICMERYERNQILFTLHSLRSEQNREIAIRGLEKYLKIN